MTMHTDPKANMAANNSLKFHRSTNIFGDSLFSINVTLKDLAILIEFRILED